MEILLYITKIVLCIIIGIVILHFGSRIQMRAWLKELDLHLGRKLVDYINNKSKKEENGTKEKKEF